MEISEIVDQESFRAWLEDKPKQWAQVIAARVALRVAPLAWSVAGLTDEQLSKEHRENLTLMTFRVNFISSAVCKYPADDMTRASASAASFPVTSAASFPVTSAAYAASVYASSASTSITTYFDAANAVAYANASAAYTDVAASTDIWGSVRADCEWLEGMVGNISHSFIGEIRLTEVQTLVLNLMREPLWVKLHSPDTLPIWAKEKFRAFTASDLAQTTSFGLITDWYRSVLQGKSGFMRSSEVEIAQMVDKDWQGDPVEVMDRVAEIANWSRDMRRGGDFYLDDDGLEESLENELDFASSNILLSQYMSDLPYGIQIKTSQKYLEFDLKFENNDLDVARVLNENGRLELARDKANDLLQKSNRVENQRAWSDLSKAASKINDWLQNEPEQMTKRIALGWDLSVSIGTFIELDEKIIDLGNQSSDDKLDADIRRSLDDLNSTLITIIREFPTGEKEDEKHKAWNESAEILEAAKDLIEEVESKQLLISGHFEVLALALRNSSFDQPQGRKNAAWGTGTVQKLVATSLICSSVVAGGLVGGVTGEIGAEVARKTELSKKSAEFILSGQDKITQILKNAPPNVRASYKEQLKLLLKEF